MANKQEKNKEIGKKIILDQRSIDHKKEFSPKKCPQKTPRKNIKK